MKSLTARWVWHRIQQVARPRLRLGAALVVAGLLTGGVGTVVGIAAATVASAAGLSACGSSLAIVPGDSGTCSQTITDSTSPTNTSTVDVTVVVSTVSTSGGGAPSATPPVATEAPLDGTPSGLQVVSITDTQTGATVHLGAISCYTDSTKTSPASYPTAAYCASSSSPQLIASDVDNATFSNTLVIKWAFPLAAGNPYQGGGATISITPTFTGVASQQVVPRSTPTPTVTPTPTPSGGVLGQSTTSPTPSPSVSPKKHHAVLGASTPTTGADVPIVLSRVLIVVGLGLLFAGLVIWRRQRYYSHS